MAYKEKHRQISFRLPENEVENFNKRVEQSKMSKEKFLRKCALGEPIVSSDVVKAAMQEIKKQGVNLNQIARSCNMGNAALEIPRIERTAKEVEEAWQFLRQSIQKSTRQRESRT